MASKKKPMLFSLSELQQEFDLSPFSHLEAEIISADIMSTIVKHCAFEFRLKEVFSLEETYIMEKTLNNIESYFNFSSLNYYQKDFEVRDKHLLDINEVDRITIDNWAYNKAEVKYESESMLSKLNY